MDTLDAAKADALLRHRTQQVIDLLDIEGKTTMSAINDLIRDATTRRHVLNDLIQKGVIRVEVEYQGSVGRPITWLVKT